MMIHCDPLWSNMIHYHYVLLSHWRAYSYFFSLRGSQPAYPISAAGARGGRLALWKGKQLYKPKFPRCSKADHNTTVWLAFENGRSRKIWTLIHDSSLYPRLFLEFSLSRRCSTSKANNALEERRQGNQKLQAMLEDTTLSADCLYSADLCSIRLLQKCGLAILGNTATSWLSEFLTWWNEQDMCEIWTFWTSTQEIEQEKSQLMEQKEAAAIATASSCQLPWLNGRDRSRRWFASWQTCIAPAPKQGFRPQTVRQLSGHPATHSNTRNAVQMAI